MKGFFYTLILGALLCCATASAAGVEGVIGDTDCAFRAGTVEAGASLRVAVNMRGAALLQIREVYPDTPQQPRYTYDVMAGDRVLLKRDHVGAGFGPVSCFVVAPRWAAGANSIRIVNRGDAPIRIMGVQPVSAESLNRLEQADSFGLLGLAPWTHGANQVKDWVGQLASQIPVKPGFYKGYSTELYFAAWPDAAIQEQIDKSVEWAKQFDMAFFPLLVSWWAGTPVGIPDGDGGTFRDLKYQQICWSPEHTVDDTPELKPLLGDRWDVRYCLSIPNEWSDTPWLTMNSPRLNAFRHERLDRALRALCERLKSADLPVCGIALDNEPRYWDTQCEAGNQKRKFKTMWADFNPLTTADALKEGVALDPADGLDAKERMWLQRNVARYNQNTVNWTRETLKAVDSKLRADVYTHSLQLVGFPGDAIGHTMAEWAYAKGALTGLEGMWMKVSDLDRVREWGGWANLNREEGDGVDIGRHLWDLRLSYARGARFYNSYNWYCVDLFAYMRRFLDALPSVNVAEPKVQKADSGGVTFTTSLDIQAFNRIEAQIDLVAKQDDALVATVTGTTGRILGFARAEGPFPKGVTRVSFTFADPIDLSGDILGPLTNASFTVQPEHAASAANVTVNDADFWFDLRRERTQSLWTIAKAERAK